VFGFVCNGSFGSEFRVQAFSGPPEGGTPNGREVNCTENAELQVASENFILVV
jgi:hypothetical protein